MSLFQEVENDFQQALKEKKQDVVSTLRMLLAALKNEQIKKQAELEDSDVTKVLKSEIKKRKESIDEYTKANRPELAETEKKELDILEKYLPDQMSEDDVRAKVKEIIAKIDSDNFGQIMGQVMGQLKDQADGALVKKIVEEELNQ